MSGLARSTYYYHQKHRNRIQQRERRDADLNEVWISDITYIKIQTGFAFLAIIMDLCFRKIVGGAISKCLEKSIALEALKMAIEKRSPSSGCIHHLD